MARSQKDTVPFPVAIPDFAAFSFFSFLSLLDGQNHQSPMASVQRTWSTLASHSAVPRGTNVKRVTSER